MSCRSTCAVYNDEDPATGEEYFTKAHAKGVVLLRGNSTTWLQHSAPQFPQVNGTLAHAQSIYGQHFFCVRVRLLHTLGASAFSQRVLWQARCRWFPCTRLAGSYGHQAGDSGTLKMAPCAAQERLMATLRSRMQNTSEVHARPCSKRGPLGL
jgi:Deoxyribonuclease II